MAGTGMVRANVYYVSVAGNDANTGTIDDPLFTVSQAISKMNAGDTIYILGGTYLYNTTIDISSSKIGSDSMMYNVFAFQSDTVVLDFYKQAFGSRGINLKGSYWYFRGITVKNAGDNGLYISGAHNRIEHCTFIGNDDTGLQISGGGSYNTIINCDSYYNADPGNGNADGFAAKLDIGPGNRFFSCRAWNNSDDGWDLYESADSVVIDSCFAFRNGYLANGAAGNGNGNGFKVGGNFVAGNHLVMNCISFGNLKNGYHLNNNTGQLTLYNNLGFNNNDKNYNFPLTSSGPHTFINNVSFGGTNSDKFTNCNQTTNSWQGFSPSADDYISLDEALATDPRLPDGNLPSNNFARLKPGSPLIDAGTDTGYPFEGAAPDLGPYESPAVTTPDVVNVTIVGQGSVRIEPSGGIYDQGQELTLIAMAAPEYNFGQWSGDISGTADTLVFTLDSTTSVTAAFVPDTTVSKDSTRIEAEDMILTGGYIFTRLTGASNGKVIVAGSSTSFSTASYTFTGDSGNYLAHVNYFDQTTDSATYKLLINGVPFGTWLGNKAVSKNEFVVKTVYNLPLKAGDKIQLQSDRSGTEYGMIDYLDLIKSPWILVGIKPTRVLASGVSVKCIPNPLSSKGEIEFYIEEPTTVRIDIFDLQGRYIRNICNGSYESGTHYVGIERGVLSDGIYIIRTMAEKRIISQKLIVR